MAVSDFISNGGFGIGSYDRAKAAGYSDLDIYNFLGSYGGTIGDQVRQNMSAFNQSQAQSQQGLGIQSYNRALASGQTPQQFFDYAKSSGLTIGGGLQAEMDKYTKSQSPMQFQDAKDVTQALRIAGSDRNISKKEAAAIRKQFGVTDAQIVKRTDKLNAGSKERGNDLKIGLGSNYVNYITKNQPKGWKFDQLMGKNIYGDGRIGETIGKYRDAAYTLKPGQGMTLGSWDERAKAQSAAGLIPLQRGGVYQVNSAGGYSPKSFGSGSPTPTQQMSPYSYTPSTTETPGTIDTPVTTNQPEAPTSGGPGMMSGGGSGAAGANRLGRAKSRIQKLGLYGRGTGLLGRGLQYGNALNI
jgi:hypothetical protein